MPVSGIYAGPPPASCRFGIHARYAETGRQVDQQHQLGMQALQEGRAGDAQTLFQQAVEQARQLGETSPKLGRAYSNLGIACRVQGRLPEAEDAFRKTVDIARETMDPTDPMWPRTLFDLGEVLLARRKSQEAKPILHEALVKMLNTGHSNIKLMQMVCNALGSCYEALGDYENARKCFRRASLVSHRYGESS